MEKNLEINFNELKKNVIEIKNMGWIKSHSKGYSGVGITFEKLLNIKTGNFELPDYKEIEIKTKCAERNFYITLFNATPDSYIFEIKRIHEKYGYPDRKNPKYKVFNVSIYGNKLINISNKYRFKLHIDKNKQQVSLNVYNNDGFVVDNLSAWSFQLIEEKLKRKLNYLLFVKAKRKMMNGEVYYKYDSFYFYKLKDFNTLLEMIENGDIRISFLIGVFKSGKRKGQIHDHGTSFEVYEEALGKLFHKVMVLD